MPGSGALPLGSLNLTPGFHGPKEMTGLTATSSVWKYPGVGAEPPPRRRQAAQSVGPVSAAKDWHAVTVLRDPVYVRLRTSNHPVDVDQ